MMSNHFATRRAARRPIGRKCRPTVCRSMEVLESRCLLSAVDLAYSSYLGGNGIPGSGEEDVGSAITVDRAGNVYVVGYTTANDFPVTAGAFQTRHGGGGRDAFVAKFDPLGRLRWSTFLGGNGNEYAFDVAVDEGSGNVYVTGSTPSTDFPTTPGALRRVLAGGSCSGVPCGDAFLSVLNPDGTGLVYSTYIGGDDADDARGLAIDGSGTAYIFGSTISTNFPVTPSAYQPTFGGGRTFFYDGDAFVAVVRPAPNPGSTAPSDPSDLVYSTYFGGASNEIHYGGGIALDSQGKVYITGHTRSPNFPTTPGCLDTSYNGGYDAYVAKFDTAMSGSQSLVYATVIGGTGDESGYSIAVDAEFNAYVTGSTSSVNFPRVNPIQSTKSAGNDAFVAKVNSNCSGLVYATFLGGTGNNDIGLGISLGRSMGNQPPSVYVTGATDSTNFPTVDTLQPHGGGNDAFVSQIGPDGSAFVYSTYFGGSNSENFIAGDIVVDSGGTAYITGLTASSNNQNFPLTPDAFQRTFGGPAYDAFLARLSQPTGNQPPITTDDEMRTAEDSSLSFPAGDLAANDQPGPPNENGQTLTVTAVTATADTHGVVSLSNGSVRYVPESDFNGRASFQYTVCDNGTTNGQPDPKCATGLVRLTVTEVNDPPRATTDEKTTNQNSSLSIPAGDLTANDTAGPINEDRQVLSVSSVVGTAETHGTVNLNSGIVRYTPDTGFVGAASFQYTVCDDGTTNGLADPMCAVGLVRVTVTERAGLRIVLKKGPNLLNNPAASAAFDQAARFIESVLSDPITVAVDAEIEPLAPNVLGNTATQVFVAPYSFVRDRMASDAAADESVVTRLPTTASVSFLAPTGSSFQGRMSAARANLLALGVPPEALLGRNCQFDPAVLCDMRITFSSTFPFDFDRGNGIAPGQFDFIGVAIHEIAHGFGFLSFVDAVDTRLPEVGELLPSPLDLFRLRPGAGQSNFTGSPRILAPGAFEPFQVTFDGGIFDPSGINIPGLTRGDLPMSTGIQFGDGRQASHWKDDQVTGITIGGLDPTLSPGTPVPWTASDTRALGLIGWDVQTLDQVGGPSDDLIIWPEFQSSSAPQPTAVAMVQEASECDPTGAGEEECDVPPIADDQGVLLSEDDAAAIELTGNDPNGAVVTFAIARLPEHGVVTGFNPATGTLTYRPNHDYSGVDSVTFRVNDGQWDSEPATVSILVDPVNDPPRVEQRAVPTPEDTPVAIDLRQFASDVETSSDALTLRILTSTHGSTALLPDGHTVRFTPEPNYTGTAKLRFSVADTGDGDSPPIQVEASVSVEVLRGNDPPQSAEQAVEVRQEGRLVFSLPASDPDAADRLSYHVVLWPEHGRLTLDAETGSVEYLPFEGYAGPDRFAFTATDGERESNTASVTITVKPLQTGIDLTDGVLTVVGTSGNDSLRLLRRGTGYTVTSSFAAPFLVRNRSVVKGVVVYSLDGNDMINLAALPGGQSAEVYGGPGNDRITGGAGADILRGGSGNDVLTGGKGNNILIGGEGSDRLVGSSGSDLLAGGRLVDPSRDLIFSSVLDTWRVAMTREDKLAAAQPLLDHILDDSERDLLTGGLAADLFGFQNLDRIIDRVAEDVVV